IRPPMFRLGGVTRAVVRSLPWSLLLAAAAQTRIVDATTGASIQQPYRERVDVARVIVDVRVTDGSSKPIIGLTAADFSVKIDGKAAPVDTVEWIGGGAPGDSAAVPPGPAPPDAPAIGGRWIVFFFQRQHNLWNAEGLMRLRRDLGAFAGMTAAGGRIAVLSLERLVRLWW